MKKNGIRVLYLLAFLFVMLFTIGQPVEAASSKTMKKAYVRYLKKNVSGKKYFKIVNIGDKNKPVLLIGREICDKKARTYVTCDIYYYQKGKVKRLAKGYTSEGGRGLSLFKKEGQYYLGNGLSDAAFYVCIRSNKTYEYAYYNGYGKSILKKGRKTKTSFGMLQGKEYEDARDSFKLVKRKIKFVKNTDKNRKKI